MMDITRNRHGGNEYSDAAHRRTEKERDLYRLYHLMFSRYPDGLTADEASILTGMPYTTCSARFTEMKSYVWIEHCGSRTTRTGNPAGVWRTIRVRKEPLK
jgi:hypothetical protein